MFSFDAPAFSPVGLDGPARLIDVHDGDTISVVSRLDNDEESKEYSFHVRLMGTDAAEMNSKDPKIKKFAQKARQRVIDLLNPRGVEISKEEVLIHLEIVKLDKFGGRFIGNVWSTADKSQENISQTLLREGYAKPFTGKVAKIPWTVADIF